MSKSASKTTRRKGFQTLRGMHDILPKEGKKWSALWEVGREVSELHDFTLIETPIVEPIGVFESGVGAYTDIVEKEMFSFATRGKESVVLRPEGTASVMRSYLQHHLGHFSSPLKVFYMGPMFRYERPQAGRYRQFHQWGFEIIGDADPFYDVQIILTTLNFLEALGIKNTQVRINTVGCKVCRPTYRKKLVGYYKGNKKDLCKDCLRRHEKNPFRLLDCTVGGCKELRGEAPVILDHLCQNCNAHLRQALELMEESNIDYQPDPYLVRGLDYYSRTVFEVVAPEDKDFALAGGGRYDYLAELLGGGRNIPAVGVSIGLERILEYMEQKKILLKKKAPPSIFFIVVGEEAKKRGLACMNKLRVAGMKVAESVGKKSLKKQLGIADKAGAKLALILGQRECFEETIIIRNMNSGAQETVPLDKVAEEAKKRLR